MSSLSLNELQQILSYFIFRDLNSIQFHHYIYNLFLFLFSEIKFCCSNNVYIYSFYSIFRESEDITNFLMYFFALNMS